MNDPGKLILFYIHGIWRRKWIAAAICWTVCLVGWAAVFKIDNTFESTARVYVDVDSLLTPLLRGLAVDSNPLQQLDYMQRTLLSRPNLEQVIHLADMDSQAKNPADKEQLLKDLASTVRLNLQGQNLFNISYQDTDPVEAKNVVKAVLTVFSETSAGNNRSEMDNARRFLEEQIASYEKQLRAAETRRAQFRETYGDILPQAAVNQTRLEQLRDQVQKLRFALDDAVAKRDSLVKESSGVLQYLTLDQAASVIINNGASGPSATKIQLDDARHKLVDLQSRYTDDFPDVVSLKRNIQSLEKQAEQDRKQPATENSGPPTADPSRHSTVLNPVYEQFKMRVADAEGTVASLRRQLEVSEKDQHQLDESVHAAPGIELQAQNLDRDYDVLKKNYEQLIQRREAANLAQAADTQADKVQFRVVDSPQVPLKPVAPNRPILYSGVLIAGLGAGIGAAFLLLQLDRSFSTLSSLRSFGLPVLGTISRVTFIDSRRRVIQQTAILAASAFALLLVYGVLLVLNYGALHRII